MDNLTGTEFGNYLIAEELERSAHRITYRASDIRSGRTVRLDVLSPLSDEQSDLGDTYLRQATTAAQLINPVAATVFDAGIIDFQPFVVSQYVDAPSLSGIVAAENLNPPRSIAILSQIASVLDEAHGLNIVHGDIRPENILIRSGDQALVCGFGLPDDAIQTSAIDPERARWIAPEQVAGSNPAPATDVYQLGTLAYFLLTGVVPFDQRNTNELFEAHLNDLPVPAHELNTELSPQASLVIQTAMAKQPADRFQTATAFIDRLSAAFDSTVRSLQSTSSMFSDSESATESTVELFPREQQRRRHELVGLSEENDVDRSLTKMGIIAGGCLMLLLVILGAGFGAATAVEMIGAEEKPTPTTPENIVVYATFTATPTLEPRPTRTFPPPLPTATATATPLPTSTPTGGNSSAQSTLPPFSTASTTTATEAVPTGTQAAQRTPTSEPTPTNTAEPTNTPVPTQITAPPAPQEAGVQYDRALNEWRNDEFSQGWIRPGTSTLRIGVYGDGSGQTMQGWTAVDDWDDISVTVDLRATTTGLDAVGCVALRHDVNQGEYQLCMFATGETWATYNFFSSSQGWQNTELLAVEERSETRPPQSWNTLKIVGKDDEFWFYANGQLLGFAEHDGRDEGSAAIQVTNWDDSDAEFEFRNLVVQTVN